MSWWVSWLVYALIVAAVAIGIWQLVEWLEDSGDEYYEPCVYPISIDECSSNDFEKFCSTESNEYDCIDTCKELRYEIEFPYDNACRYEDTCFSKFEIDLPACELPPTYNIDELDGLTVHLFEPRANSLLSVPIYSNVLSEHVLMYNESVNLPTGMYDNTIDRNLRDFIIRQIDDTRVEMIVRGMPHFRFSNNTYCRYYDASVNTNMFSMFIESINGREGEYYIRDINNMYISRVYDNITGIEKIEFENLDSTKNKFRWSISINNKYQKIEDFTVFPTLLSTEDFVGLGPNPLNIQRLVEPDCVNNYLYAEHGTNSHIWNQCGYLGKNNKNNQCWEGSFAEIVDMDDDTYVIKCAIQTSNKRCIYASENTSKPEEYVRKTDSPKITDDNTTLYLMLELDYKFSLASVTQGGYTYMGLGDNKCSIKDINLVAEKDKCQWTTDFNRRIIFEFGEESCDNAIAC